ncbi:MAG: NAD(+)/NADH kinase [Eubacteriales bacterium]|nr:NAD(+)/NADH kinase [Eubacteriales bacterium]
MEIKRAGVFSNKKKDIGLKGAALVAQYLRERGIAVSFDADGMPDGEADVTDCARVDCLFVLGGDGTILKAATMASAYGVSMLGINLGRLGFLTEVELHCVEDAIDNILGDRYYLEKRLMLSCCVCDGDNTVYRVDALNDAAVLKKDMSRMINIELIINGAAADNVPCDGMLASTPTGSTGYSLSAGGPIVSPKLECILATPICPHTLHSRTLVVSPDEELVIKPTSPRGMVLTTDGILQRELNNGEVVKIKRSEHLASFIRFNENYFYPLLRSKFINWDR